MVLGYRFGAPVMMQLGSFQFGIATAAYQELTRASEWRWPEQELIGERANMQHIGPGPETMSLPGVIYPEWKGGFGQLDAMRALGDAGEPLALIDGSGGSLGQWIIDRVEEKQTTFADEGKPRKIEFTLSLRRFAGVEPGGAIAAPPAAALAGAVAMPGAEAGQVARVGGLAGTVSTAAKSLAGTLSKAAERTQAALAPFADLSRSVSGGIARALDVAHDLDLAAGRARSMIGSLPSVANALAGAEHLATRAAGLAVVAESAGSLLRSTAAKLEAQPGVSIEARASMAAATVAADQATALARRTANLAGEIKA